MQSSLGGFRYNSQVRSSYINASLSTHMNAPTHTHLLRFNEIPFFLILILQYEHVGREGRELCQTESVFGSEGGLGCC